jgi:hypothetical protein
MTGSLQDHEGLLEMMIALRRQKEVGKHGLFAGSTQTYPE